MTAELTPVPAQILRGRARAYRLNDPEADVAPSDLDTIVSLIRLRARECNGIGLAAPQVGLAYQIAVVLYGPHELVLVNPVLKVLSGPKDMRYDEEGCLSLPGRGFRVRRHARVQVTTYVEPNDPMSIVASGHLARVLQHEYDHLRGVLVDSHGVEVATDGTLLDGITPIGRDGKPVDAVHAGCGEDVTARASEGGVRFTCARCGLVPRRRVVPKPTIQAEPAGAKA